VRIRAGFWLASLSIAALFLATLSGAAARQSSLETPPPVGDLDEGPLVVPGDPPDLILIYTGAVVGYVDPCG
jgi:hypothetical protein